MPVIVDALLLVRGLGGVHAELIILAGIIGGAHRGADKDDKKRSDEEQERDGDSFHCSEVQTDLDFGGYRRRLSACRGLGQGLEKRDEIPNLVWRGAGRNFSACLEVCRSRTCGPGKGRANQTRPISGGARGDVRGLPYAAPGLG